MIRNVALIVFYDKKKNILLQRKEPGSRRKYKEMDWHFYHILFRIWGFFGGGIEKGETQEQALIREVKEELDFDLEEYRFIGKFKHKFSGERSTIKFVFIAPIKNNFSKFTQLEGIDMRFFSLEKAEKLHMIPGDKEVIKKLNKIL